METERQLVRRIRALLVAFMAGLVVSGLTAFPVETELDWLLALFGVGADAQPQQFVGLMGWLVTVRNALAATNRAYPFLAYGTDWLAFAHLVIAVAFVGPLIDPARNRWVVTFGLIACAGVPPLAVIAGAIRGIPFYWRLVDSAFGVVGFAVLWPCRAYIDRLENGRALKAKGGI